MIEIIRHPDRKDWPVLVQRPQSDANAVTETVKAIIDKVKIEGDQAVKFYEEKFTGYVSNDFLVSANDLASAERDVSDELRQAISQAKTNIESFHSQQLGKDILVETMPGVKCWRKQVPIEKVGLYIPGGSAPLFSTVLMLGIPARIAGCENIVLCTPRDKQGRIHPAILYTAQLIGISTVYGIGGAQAVAAMAFGTSSVPRVDKIFGPGNQFVTAAKQMVQMQGTAIDMPAGPSELCIIADATANPAFIAADLLSQAEHGADSQVMLITNSDDILNQVLTELGHQLQSLPRKEIAARALLNSKAVLVPDLPTAIDLSNEYAPEHLMLMCDEANSFTQRIRNAGSVFVGHYAPESVGDYASGTNHTLPTNGFARAYSGISVDSFMKTISFQQLSYEGLEGLASTVITMAEEEQLKGHARAVEIRLKKK